MSDLKRLVQEVHRRSLWQVLGVYMAGSWIALQVVEQLAEAANLPPWVRPFALVLLVLGLPVVMATAFIQQGAGGGVRSPEPAAGDVSPSDDAMGSDDPPWSTDADSAAHRLFTWRHALTGGVVAVAAWGIVATGILLAGRGSSLGASAGGASGEVENRNVVAVLPFQNLSPDESNAFFADGVHEEVLSSLSQIDALRVISRTSVLRYESSDLSLPEIGRQLGAGAVLEGSVRRANDRVRVTAQLIEVATDQHLWSRTFDGDLSDIFAIQTEIAQEIALALAAELTDEDLTRIQTRPTENLAAYDAYLEGLSRQRRRFVEAEARQAAESFRRAVELDPEFAEAWAGLAHAEIWLEWYYRVPDAAAAAFGALAKAQALAPGTFGTLMAEGQVRYYGELDLEGALESFFAAERLAPNRAEVIEFIGHIRRRQGRWDDAFRRWMEALELDPYSDLAYTIGQSHFLRRDYAESERYVDLGLASSPGLQGAHAIKFMSRYVVGDTAGARAVIEEAGDHWTDPDYGKAWLAIAAGDPEEAVRLDPPAALRTGLALTPGLIGAALAGQAVRRAAADTLRAAVERNRDTMPLSRFGEVRAEFGRAYDDAWLGLADALDGNYTAARERLNGALRVHSFSVDAMGGYRGVFAAALIEILAGEPDAAIEHLETLLSRPSPVSVEMLEMLPLFDSIRETPGFQDLLERYRGP